VVEKGIPCKTGEECASSFCSNGVCCNVACTGACVSCDLTAHAGKCFPIEVGAPDPRAVCSGDQGAATCGRTGLCDGYGGCAKYPRGTICDPSLSQFVTCANARYVNLGGLCDGEGTCGSAGSLYDCAPYRCADGACTTTCQQDGDCEDGIACANGRCGP
jgi:hypothetical protein